MPEKVGSKVGQVLAGAGQAVGNTAMGVMAGAAGAATSGGVIAAQAGATAATDAAQLANIAFMTHNTLNGIMLEQFSATMETLRKINHLGAKTLDKSVPEPP